MAAKTLQELAKLVEGQQKTLEAQQKEIQRLRDVHEIQNFMGRYNFYHEVNRDYEYPDTMYAQKAPDISGEVAHGGCYVGREGVRRMYTPLPGREPGPMKGGLFTHPLTTPVIEIAGDGKTAKGAWIAPGYETRTDPETKEMTGTFAYTKYGCDFIKEDGAWKMWHYHVYRVFMTPWNVPFTDEWEKKHEEKTGDVFGGERKPDLPPTVDNPYSKDTVREMAPVPPEPYETFSETFSYGPPAKK